MVARTERADEVFAVAVVVREVERRESGVDERLHVDQDLGRVRAVAVRARQLPHAREDPADTLAIAQRRVRVGGQATAIFLLQKVAKITKVEKVVNVQKVKGMNIKKYEGYKSFNAKPPYVMDISK